MRSLKKNLTKHNVRAVLDLTINHGINFIVMHISMKEHTFKLTPNVPRNPFIINCWFILDLQEFEYHNCSLTIKCVMIHYTQIAATDKKAEFTVGKARIVKCWFPRQWGAVLAVWSSTVSVAQYWQCGAVLIVPVGELAAHLNKGKLSSGNYPFG